MACRRDVINAGHTYSSDINMYCSARQTSFLSTNSVSEDHLRRLACEAIMSATRYADLNNREKH